MYRIIHRVAKLNQIHDILIFLHISHENKRATFSVTFWYALRVRLQLIISLVLRCRTWAPRELGWNGRSYVPNGGRSTGSHETATQLDANEAAMQSCASTPWFHLTLCLHIIFFKSTRVSTCWQLVAADDSDLRAVWRGNWTRMWFLVQSHRWTSINIAPRILMKSIKTLLALLEICRARF